MSTEQFQTLGKWQETGPDSAIALIEDIHGRVVLQLRDDFENVTLGGFWGMFGGQVEPGESLITAVAREIEEETSLQFDENAYLPFVRMVSDHGHRHFVFKLQSRITPSQIRVGEGAGFACFRQQQLSQIKLLPAARKVLNYHFGHPA